MRPSRVTRSHGEPQQVVITNSPLFERLPPPSQENQAANVAHHLKRPLHSCRDMSRYATLKKYADLSSLPSGPAPQVSLKKGLVEETSPKKSPPLERIAADVQVLLPSPSSLHRGFFFCCFF